MQSVLCSNFVIKLNLWNKYDENINQQSIENLKFKVYRDMDLINALIKKTRLWLTISLINSNLKSITHKIQIQSNSDTMNSSSWRV